MRFALPLVMFALLSLAHAEPLLRNGDLLKPQRIVKLDPYPGLHTRSLQSGPSPQPLIVGADNFRRVPEAAVYGVSQPTLAALQEVLQSLGAGPGGAGSRVTWTTLREEPVLYIQGRSYTLRERSKPFENLEAAGISSNDVEQREEVLRQEIWAEALRCGGKFMVHEENPDGSLSEKWLPLQESDLQTAAEVFEQLREEGYQVDYARIPISDEKTPEGQDFDAILSRLREAPSDSPLVFNCHAGRGRTTTGMVMGQLFRQQQSGLRLPDEPATGNRFEQGQYRAVMQLVQSLPAGGQSKQSLDALIDRAAAVQNLRTAIAKLKQQAEVSQGHQAIESLARGRDYLHRYRMLLAFESYLREMAPQGFPKTFSQWLRQYPLLEIAPEGLELVFR